MAQASITLNGRIYRLNCGEGEEERLRQLSQLVSDKLDGLIAEFGQVGEDRLLLMSALLLADELVELRSSLAAREITSTTTQKRG